MRPLADWHTRIGVLQDMAQGTLFFVGGAPRSGTTWLQQLLDGHPEICCRGEGLFWRNLALPLDALMTERAHALTAKNTTLFQHTGGYRLPGPDHADMLLGTAILLALRQQCGTQTYRAVGEKTPENVFFFPRLKTLFPHAKLVVIARDPRDALASSWHMFYRMAQGEDERAAKLAFLATALPPIVEGTRQMLAFEQKYAADYRMLTYEALHAWPERELAGLFTFLGVSDDPAIVASCVERAGFAAMTGGRQRGEVDDASFHRRGLPGGWETTLTEEMNDMILRHLGWAFPKFGWRAVAGRDGSL